ncbi:MAG: release factor glutamine methyltransferase [Thermoleophilaceae bacterium]|nr:release factor glutamine methyltransferase [Thermoleophilaceae bacterium]
MASVRDALVAATLALTDAGCETPRLDAELLLAHVSGSDRARLVTSAESLLDGAHADAFDALVRRRVAREPVAYLVGRKGFRHIELAVDSRVLIPRPDTETLVEAALDLPAGARVHDVGTGSGAVALALKHERPDLEVSGSDVSADAVEVARANAASLGLDVDFSVARGLPPGRVDLVVANLPYVREDEWAELEPDITRYEPRAALVSGHGGLDAIRALASEAPPGTRLALEHAPAQAAAVRALLEGAETVRDLAGRERVTLGRAP